VPGVVKQATRLLPTLAVLGAFASSAGPAGAATVHRIRVSATAAGGLPPSQTFGYTDGEQTYVVPAGVTEVQVFAVGAKGGADLGPSPAPGGVGATATADLPVVAGQTLYVEVGGNGSCSGGFNGGGASPGACGGGGGASDVRSCSSTGSPACAAGADSLSSRLLVAGGGGGGGGTGNVTGGQGGPGGQGGATGQTYDSGLGGGPGSGGSPGTPGAGGSGGAGGPAAAGCGATAGNRGATGGFIAGGAAGGNGNVGGAGGGGEWGGGGGGAGTCGSGGGGGGGGSNYATTFASNVSFAVNSSGLASEVVITPIAGPPSASTLGATALSSTSASLTANVDPDGLDTSYRFEYGTTSGYGSDTPVTDAGQGTGAQQVSAAITGLVAGAVYHFRVVAFNSAGVALGSDQTFTTSPAPAGTTTGGGTTGGGRPSEPPPSGRITIDTRHARVSGRRTKLKLACSGSGACTGTLSLTVRLKHKTLLVARTNYDLPSGHSRMIAVRLRPLGARMLAAAHNARLRVWARATLTAGGGTSRLLVLRSGSSPAGQGRRER
jgi:hypothetical protein